MFGRGQRGSILELSVGAGIGHGLKVAQISNPAMIC